jgi:molybdopterin converting factor small subunit
MMRVTVQYMTQIKRTAGCSREEVEAPEAISLRDLLRLLADRHGSAFRTLVLDEANEPHQSLLFFVGEEHAKLSRPLCDGDAVMILTPMSGG